MELPKGTFGAGGPSITRLGLGGEGILRTFGREAEARAVIAAALDSGITYFESARAYSGSESYYGRSLGSRREAAFLATKVHERSRPGALQMLRESLDALQTSVLDLWQVHDVREQGDLAALDGPDGVGAAVREAQSRGVIRYAGVTGHHDPLILRAAFDRFPFQAVLLPVNPAEGALPDAFERTVIPAAREHGMAVIGMKVLARGLLLQAGIGVAEALAYALSADLDAVVIGCDDVAQVTENVEAARAFRPMQAAERAALEARAAPFAARLAYYRGRSPAMPSSRA